MLRVAALLGLLAIFLLLIWLGQRRLIYFPFGEVSSPAAAGLPDAEAVTFATDDGLTLGGWLVPGAMPRRPVTVIVFNGNAGNRTFRAPLAAGLAERGISTLLFDYRGYGGNPGSPAEEGLASDARAARRYVALRAGSDRIVYFGESLGSGVAVRLATEQPPSALILRSPFTSLTDTGRYHYPFLPVGLLLGDRFASIDRIRNVRCPLLVIAADRDSVIPSAQSRRLFEAALEPKRLLIVERADHNDYELLAGPRVLAAVFDFLEVLSGPERR
ncbi:MAG: alpha/beta hydrolase [Vicinamibacterales bacterium]